MSYTPPELDWERLVLIAGGHTAFQCSSASTMPCRKAVRSWSST